MKNLFFAILIVGVTACCGRAQETAKQPVELGAVKWLRDLDTAVANSKTEQKPIAILFQEVPG